MVIRIKMLVMLSCVSILNVRAPVNVGAQSNVGFSFIVSVEEMLRIEGRCGVLSNIWTALSDPKNSIKQILDSLSTEHISVLLKHAKQCSSKYNALPISNEDKKEEVAHQMLNRIIFRDYLFMMELFYSYKVDNTNKLPKDILFNIALLLENKEDGESEGIALLTDGVMDSVKEMRESIKSYKSCLHTAHVFEAFGSMRLFAERLLSTVEPVLVKAQKLGLIKNT